MDDELRHHVRQVIQEEMSAITPPPSTHAITQSTHRTTAQDLISRTQSLIRNSASSCLPRLPNHPNRVASSTGRGKKRKSEVVRITSHELQVLHQIKNDADSDFINDYPLREEHIHTRQVMIDLKSDYKEEDIRNKIVSVLKNRIPNLTKNDFEFVKRDKGRIYTPVVEDDYKFDYNQIRKLAGNGKIYIRLTKDLDSDRDSSSSDSDFDLPSVLRPRLQSNQFGNRATLPGSSNEPCCSRSIPQNSVPLSEIFPDVPSSAFDEFSDTDVNQAANIIADRTGTAEVSNMVPNISNNVRHRLIVTEETILEDSFCYYKGQDFDPEKPLRIVFQDQTAIDAGGPLRQFFTLLGQKIGDRFFEGEANNLLPRIDANTILSEVFVVVGKIISHSIVHGCSGFPYLSQAAYHYLCSGSIMDAACFVSLEQVASRAYKHYIEEIQNSGIEELETLRMDDELTQMIEESGEVCSLNVSTKDKVIQSMMIYDILVKRKASLDQLRSGLKMLNVMEIVSNNPNSMGRFFLYNQDDFTPEKLIGKLEFDITTSIEQKHLLINVLQSLSCHEIERFSIFVSGFRSFHQLSKIKVKFSDSSSIFASTCDIQIVIPNTINDESLLKAALAATTSNDWKDSFNTY